MYGHLSITRGLVQKYAVYGRASELYKGIGSKICHIWASEHYKGIGSKYTTNGHISITRELVKNIYATYGHLSITRKLVQKYAMNGHLGITRGLVENNAIYGPLRKEDVEGWGLAQDVDFPTGQHFHID